MKHIIALALVLAFGTTTFAQDCFQYVRECKTSKKEGYGYNGQSKSGAFKTGDTTRVVVVAYQSMDYKISLCSDDEQVDGKIEFRVIEKIKKPYYKEFTSKEEVEKLDADGNPIYDEDGNPIMETITKTVKKRRFKTKEYVRYDSKKSEHDFFSIRSDQTRKFYIQVIVPPGSGAGADAGLEAEDGVTYACVGLLIEHRKAPKMGFVSQ